MADLELGNIIFNTNVNQNEAIKMFDDCINSLQNIDKEEGE